MTIAGVEKSVRQSGMIIASFPFTKMVGKHQENEP
jgi:hypothetical protein